MIETTGEGKSAVATPDGKKPKEEEDCSWLQESKLIVNLLWSGFFLTCLTTTFTTIVFFLTAETRQSVADWTLPDACTLHPRLHIQ